MQDYQTSEWVWGNDQLAVLIFARPFLQVMDNTEIHVVPNILMMVGLASIGTNWFASRVCQDSLDASRFPRWKVPLLAWYAGAALLCCLLLSVVVLSYALQGRLEESLKVGYTIRGGITLWRVKCRGLRRCGLFEVNTFVPWQCKAGIQLGEITYKSFSSMS